MLLYSHTGRSSSAYALRIGGFGQTSRQNARFGLPAKSKPESSELASRCVRDAETEGSIPSSPTHRLWQAGRQWVQFPPSRLTMNIVLASSSAGRKSLLETLHIPFTVIPSIIDEDKILGKTPEETVMLRARLKAEDILHKIQTGKSFSSFGIRHLDISVSSLVIAADSSVILGDELIGKPTNYKEAHDMLIKLSGRDHTAITAHCIIRIDNGKEVKRWKPVTKATVSFKKLTEEDITRYLSLLNYKQFAGSYTLLTSPQDFITKVEGSLTSVIGLSLGSLIPILKENSLLK